MSTVPRPDRARFTGLLAPTYRAWTAANEAIPLDPVLRELVSTRSSILNGCSFCVRWHLASARRLGCTEAWIDGIATWRTAWIFTPKERAALAWADVVTLLADDRDDEAAYAALAAHATPEEICAITAAIAQSNLWNRLAGPLRWELPNA